MASQGDIAKGFFSSLFDFNFTSFITLKFLKVIYGLLLGLTLLTGVIFFFIFLVKGGVGGVLFAILIWPIIVLLYMIFCGSIWNRSHCFFRIGENTAGDSSVPRRLRGSFGL